MIDVESPSMGNVQLDRIHLDTGYGPNWLYWSFCPQKPAGYIKIESRPSPICIPPDFPVRASANCPRVFERLTRGSVRAQG